MKTNLLPSWKGRAVALFMLGLMAGCSTPRGEKLPLRPRFVASYHKDSPYELNRLPVKLVFRQLENRERCIMVDAESTIGDPRIEKLPFRSIVEEEFKEFIRTNFCLVDANKPSRLVLEVIPSSKAPITRSPTHDVTCDISFKVIFKDSTVNSTTLLFTLDCSAKAEYHDIETITPCSLYAAIQNAVKDCGDRLFEDPDYMKSLVRLIPDPHGLLNYGEQTFMPVGKNSDHYYYKESATVACNDDEPKEVKKWAMAAIKEKWRNRRFFKNPCVFFRSKFVKETSSWEFDYDIIEWRPFIVIPDRTMSGYTGRCFVDYRKAGVINKKEELKNYMQNELLMWFVQNDDPAVDVEVRVNDEDEDNFEFRMAEYERK